MELNGKVVLVAGGSGVLGSRIAALMSEKGARILVAGRNRAKLDAVSAGIPGSAAVVFDLADASTAALPVEAAMQTYGRLDGLVNAAGVVAFGPLATTPPDIVETLIETNLIGPLRLITAALEHLEDGFIVNLTGVVAEQPVAGMVTYSAGKAGLSAASIALARELRRQKTLVVDARAPHTETGLAGRAIAGEPPRLPVGLDPGHVARVVVTAVESEQRVLEPSDFEPA